MKKSLLVLVFGIILLSSFILAATNIQPGRPPKIFSGQILYIDGTNLSDGEYSLRAVINGELVSIIDITNYEYENLQVSTGDSAYYGEIIFMINGVESLNKSSWHNYENESGEKVTLDLYFDEEILSNDPCGNKILNRNAGEQCDTEDFGNATCSNVMSLYYGKTGYSGQLGCTLKCTYDISNCTAPVTNPPSTPLSSGGGSSGGGSSGGGSPTVPAAFPSSNENTEENASASSQLTPTEKTEEEKGKFFGMTGFAVSDFAKTKTGKGVLLLVVLIVIGFFIYRYSKKANKEINK